MTSDKSTPQGILSVDLVNFVALGSQAGRNAGPRVHLDIAPRQTILIGKNGAGKSALLEAIYSSMLWAVGLARPPYAFTSFSCEAVLPSGKVGFSFDTGYSVGEATTPAATQPVATWSERCWSETEEFWRVEKGLVHSGVGGPVLSLPQNVGLLSVSLPETYPAATQANELGTLFRGAAHVAAGVPRGGQRERQLSLVDRRPNSARFPFGPQNRVDAIARAVVMWSENDRATLREFEAIGSRMGIWKKIHVRDVNLPPRANNESRQLSLVEFDDTEVGQLSDGTLRIAEVLRLLLSPSKLLLIEEPETSIHPGLLKKLLAEIATYSSDRQTIISTHSPQVVSSVTHSDVRLVRRGKKGTSVMALSAHQVGMLDAYLSEEGTLGEFVFSGAIDE